MPEADSHWRPPAPRTAASPAGPLSVGQLSGIAKGHNGTLWLLHRGPRIWDSQSFQEGGAGETTGYADAIAEDVVLQLDQDTGVARQGGKPVRLSLPVQEAVFCIERM